ncbi:hypothetical protein CTRI78_v003511 [Colletotrichum trifolii]|uniref:Uncharacterized protein n=1 Tax=Colletotrichum trifolii TaxID=5466 RepID=A0A4R8RJA4_COLTR|nr:hypothetical protein CTRI78_v003511 [Colletotrichum trifolii]
MSSSDTGPATSQATEPEILGRNREGMIADTLKNGEDVQKLYPDVKFKEAVVEPTVHLTFDIQKYISDANQRRYNTLIAEMLQHTADPGLAERLLWEARACLTSHPDVVAQFDDIFITKRPIPAMIRELHEVLSTKKETVRRMSLQNSDTGESSEGQDRV